MVSRAIIGVLPDARLTPDPGTGVTRVWPYTQKWIWPIRMRRVRWLDPLSLVVRDVGAAKVLEALTGQGWQVPADGAAHRLWIDGSLRRMAWHATLGPRAERVHVRLWDVGGHTLGAAHHERADESGHHVVLSWNAGRQAVVDALVAAGMRDGGLSDVLTQIDLRGVPSDGRIALLSPS